MAITPITDLPTPPLKTDPTNFASRADTFLDALPDFVTEMNAAIDNINTTESSLDTAVSTAEGHATDAETSATNAAASETAALANASATVYSAVASYDYPDAVIGSDGNTYRCLGTSVTGDNPVGSVTGDWQIISTLRHVPVVVTSATTAAEGYRYYVNCSSAAVTITLPASPDTGSIIRISDYAGTFETNDCTVARNGKKIMGLEEDMTMDTNYVSIALQYVDSTNGWILI